MQKIRKEAFARADEEVAAERAKERFHPFTFAELMFRKFPAAQFAVERLVPLPGITVISGDPATYKTWILLHIALCVSAGEPVFGHFEVAKSPVLIIDEENQPRLLQDRITRLTERVFHDIHFISLENFKLAQEGIQYILSYCREHEVKLVIFDSFVRVSGVRDENDAASISTVFENLKPLLTAEIAVVLAHHNNKRPGEGHPGHAMRGSSDILAALDSHIAVKRDESRAVELTQTKSRGAEELKPFRVAIGLENHRFEFDYEGEAEKPRPKREEVREAVIATVGSANSPPYQEQILKELLRLGCDVSKKTVYSVINEMVERGELLRKHGDRRKWLYELPGEASVAKDSSPM